MVASLDSMNPKVQSLVACPSLSLEWETKLAEELSPKCATGIRKKDKRLKEKTVIPVVQIGKVDIQPKRLWGLDLMGCCVF
jgi:hypothetical protein